MEDKPLTVVNLIFAIIIIWLVGFLIGISFERGNTNKKEKEVLRLIYQVDQLNSDLKIYRLEEELDRLKNERSKNECQLKNQ